MELKSRVVVGAVVGLGFWVAFLKPSGRSIFSTQIDGVAIWRTGEDELRVCSTHTLNNCRISYGQRYSGRTLDFPVVRIPRVESCDAQEARAGECRAPENRTENEQTRERAWCRAQQGMIHRDLGAVLRDPRVEQLPPGHFRMDCDEGHRDGVFNDP